MLFQFCRKRRQGVFLGMIGLVIIILFLMVHFGVEKVMHVTNKVVVYTGLQKETFHSPLLDHRRPLNIIMDPSRPVTINIVMCGMGLDFTGGPLSIMHFANEMIGKGIRVRWINRVGNGISISDLREHVLKYRNLDRFYKLGEFAFGEEAIRCHPSDLFMATIFFTVQTVVATIQSFPFLQRNFIYFIQDYEPIFFMKGSDYIEALESYRFPHFAIYSTSFLEDFFLFRCIGQCEFVNQQQLKKISFAAQPAMKRWSSLNTTLVDDSRRTKKIVVYARKHSDRNAFDLTLMALSRAICEGLFDNWQLIGVGAVADVELYLGNECGRKIPFMIYKNIPEPEYLDLIRTADIGFGLMISPHPSLPPLDFAAAGLVSVTNSFATKIKASFDLIASNFVITKPYLPDIVVGLRHASDLAHNSAFRAKGAANFKWEHDWHGPNCYGQPLYDLVHSWITRHEQLWGSPHL